MEIGNRGRIMPVMDGYAFADSPHPSTVQVNGALYGCHSSRTNDSRPRGRATYHIAHPWSKFGGVRVTTRWLDKPCGHGERATDAACEGCVNRGEAKARA